MRRPPIVERALTFAESLGFKNSCQDEVGQLLYLLVGHIRTGRVAKVGTGCGVGTAWISSGTALDIYTVDNDLVRVRGTQGLFYEMPNVHSMYGDWEQILQEGPFQFVFVDAKPAKLELGKVVDATEIGGLIVIDDLTSVEFWPEEWKGKPDVIRDVWLNNDQLISIEIRTSLEAAAILARRVW